MRGCWNAQQSEQQGVTVVQGSFVRKRLAKFLTGQSELALTSHVPTRQQLRERFESIEELGLYLHVPFCRQICPYCPYNKEPYNPETAEQYAAALKQEVGFYADIIGKRPVTSLYIGGGTPTTLLKHGLSEVLEHVHQVFNVRCDVHMESHLNDLNSENLDAIQSMGVRHLSLGVESLQDRHLRFLKRPYTAESAEAAVARTMLRGFKCVNVDLMFALPDQTCEELEQAALALAELGVQQIAAYPLFRFPYTRMGSNGRLSNYGLGIILKRRKMLKVLERIFYSAGYERSSVWAFTKSGVPRYCSVTVPLYVGLGASGGSYLRDVFYLNTFNVSEYIRAVEEKGTAIALSLDLSERMQMAGWLYWRIYETRCRKADFLKRFGQSFDSVYGKYFKLLGYLGFLTDNGEQITLTDAGAYWLHALEDVFSIEYISKLWGTSKEEPWPQEVLL
jgi:oxygen-independent coproporphyrinogen-3 oxidase